MNLPDAHINNELPISETPIRASFDLRPLDMQKEGYSEEAVKSMIADILPQIGKMGKKELRQISTRLMEYEAENFKTKKILSAEFRSLISTLLESINDREFAIDDGRKKEVERSKLQRELSEFREDMQIESAREKVDKIPDNVIEDMLTPKRTEIPVSTKKKKGFLRGLFGGQ